MELSTETSPKVMSSEGREIESAYELYRSRRRFPGLDGYRGLCILAVIWHHIPRELPEPLIAGRGFLGVDGFFVLSGFLIVTLLLREQSRSSNIRLRDFYVRRALRIFPIYYVLVAAIGSGLLITKPMSATMHEYVGSLPYLLTYTTNWVPIYAVNLGITWSLATEEQFYLVWPSIEKWLPRGFVWCVLALGLLINQLWNFGVLDRWLGSASGLLEIGQVTFTPILLGVALAHCLHSPRGFRLLHRILAHRWSLIAVLSTLLLLLLVAPPDLRGWPRLLIQLVMAMILGVLVVPLKSYGNRLFEFAPLARIGVVSYGLYLYHMWGIHFVREGLERVGRPVGQSLFYVLALGLSWTIAELSFRLIESPMLRLKDRYRDPGARAEAR
jgi:peptidoglycan/LPS O-acetylase OafA/YrhL